LIAKNGMHLKQNNPTNIAVIIYNNTLDSEHVKECLENTCSLAKKLLTEKSENIFFFSISNDESKKKGEPTSVHVLFYADDNLEIINIFLRSFVYENKEEDTYNKDWKDTLSKFKFQSSKIVAFVGDGGVKYVAKVNLILKLKN
jgi:hypothetical protein